MICTIQWIIAQSWLINALLESIQAGCDTGGHFDCDMGRDSKMGKALLTHNFLDFPNSSVWLLHILT